MKKIFNLALVFLMFVGMALFVRSWRKTSPQGMGTGDIAGKSSDLAARDQRPLGQKVRSKLREISDNPLRFKDQRMTIKGRVRGAGKLASNRNIYTITEGRDSLLVIDDKTPPKDYWTRTVSGVVKVVGPPVGGLQRAYLVDVKEGVKFNAPKWSELKDYFTRSANG